MFTGIIEETGEIISTTAETVTIKCSKVLEDTKIGDSICVNGVCLTVTKLGSDYFTADVSPQTRKVTALSRVKKGDFVNLERALTLLSRLGGHIVSGHTDTVGKIIKISKMNDFYEVTVGFDKKFGKYVADRGSIAVDGISLTVASCKEDSATIAVIPHTFENTVLKYLKAWDDINIEFDILSKYVEKFLLTGDNNNNITVNFLAENGFC